MAKIPTLAVIGWEPWRKERVYYLSCIDREGGIVYKRPRDVLIYHKISSIKSIYPVKLTLFRNFSRTNFYIKSIHSSFYQSIYIYLSLYISIYLSIYLSFYIYIQLSIHLSIYLHIYLTIYLLICMPTKIHKAAIFH